MVDGDGCELTHIADFAFPSNSLGFFYVMWGGDGSAVQFFDTSGQKITINDDKKLLDGWVVGSIDQVGWDWKYNANIGKLHLWKNLGADNAEVIVDVDKMKILPETFTPTSSE